MFLIAVYRPPFVSPRGYYIFYDAMRDTNLANATGNLVVKNDCVKEVLKNFPNKIFTNQEHHNPNV